MTAPSPLDPDDDDTSEITEEDILHAAQAWRKDAPMLYRHMLDATPVEEEPDP